MFSRFTSDARRVVRCAENEACDLGSPAVEAEHLLLALTWTDEATMAAAGLDREALALALEAERERSLMAVGISAADFDVPRALAQAGVDRQELRERAAALLSPRTAGTA